MFKDVENQVQDQLPYSPELEKKNELILLHSRFYTQSNVHNSDIKYKFKYKYPIEPKGELILFRQYILISFPGFGR